jgi:histidine triad (HIT) family protein
LFSKKVALAIEKSVPCTRVAVAVIGLEVPHVHIHLIPIQKESDLNFASKKEIASEEMVSVAQLIASNF